MKISLLLFLPLFCSCNENADLSLTEEEHTGIAGIHADSLSPEIDSLRTKYFFLEPGDTVNASGFSYRDYHDDFSEHLFWYFYTWEPEQ